MQIVTLLVLGLDRKEIISNRFQIIKFILGPLWVRCPKSGVKYHVSSGQTFCDLHTHLRLLLVNFPHIPIPQSPNPPIHLSPYPPIP